MKRPFRCALLVLAVLGPALAGCAGARERPAPVEERAVEAPPPEGAAQAGEAVVRPLREQAIVGEPLPEATPASERPVNPAVVALLENADRQSRAGRLERAGATLERALQIEPDNAWLWHRLARLRVAQGQLAQAATLAKKSSSLASNDPRLVGANWQLIAEVRKRQGDEAGAREAAARAAELAGN